MYQKAKKITCIVSTFIFGIYAIYAGWCFILHGWRDCLGVKLYEGGKYFALEFEKLTPTAIALFAMCAVFLLALIFHVLQWRTQKHLLLPILSFLFSIVAFVLFLIINTDVSQYFILHYKIPVIPTSQEMYLMYWIKYGLISTAFVADLTALIFTVLHHTFNKTSQAEPIE